MNGFFGKNHQAGAIVYLVYVELNMNEKKNVIVYIQNTLKIILNCFIYF